MTWQQWVTWAAIVLLGGHQLHSTGQFSDAVHALGAKLSGNSATPPKEPGQ